jgi:hypothetical protein
MGEETRVGSSLVKRTTMPELVTIGDMFMHCFSSDLFIFFHSFFTANTRKWGSDGRHVKLEGCGSL